MSLQLSPAAQTLGALKPHPMTMGDGLFDTIYRDLFPQEFAEPTLADIFTRDLDAGIRALRHVDLPLNADRRHIQHCLVRVLGHILHHPKVWPVVKAARMQTIAKGLQSGRMKSLQKLCNALDQRRNRLRMIRNELDGFNHATAKMHARHTSWAPTDMRKPMPPEEQPSLFDVPQLEDVHRELRLVSCVQSILTRLTYDSTDWRDTDAQFSSILRGCWGNYDRNRNDPAGPFFWKNGAQRASADRLVAYAFLEVYVTSGWHDKPNWMKAVWH